MNRELPPVSIIMPCYNSYGTLPAALEGVLALDYPVYEVVVVDDCSTDESFGMLQAYAARSPLIRVYRLETNGGVQAARDFASQKARFDWIASTDSDAVVPRDWLLQAARSFGKADLLGGRFQATPTSYLERCLNPVPPRKDAACTVFTRATTRLDPCTGGYNLFYTASAYRAIGGFDPEVRAAEDLLLVAKGIEMGLTYVFDPALYVHHPYTPQSRTFGEFVRRSWQTHKWRKVAGGRSHLIRNRNRLLAAGVFSLGSAFLGAVLALGPGRGVACFLFALAAVLSMQALRRSRTGDTPFAPGLVGVCLKFVRRVVGGTAIVLPGGPTVSGWSKRF